MQSPDLSYKCAYERFKEVRDHSSGVDWRFTGKANGQGVYRGEIEKRDNLVVSSADIKLCRKYLNCCK